jgi:hypothetical protein
MKVLRVLAVVAVLVIVFLGARWTRRVLFQERADAGRAASSSPAPVARATATPSPSPPPVLHRLAGVALGNVRYVVVEHPDGGTALYRLGEEVPGLGRIVDVTENSATFEGDLGRIRLRVTVPPSPTAAPPSPTYAKPTEAPVTPSPPPGRTATESPPSTVSDRSAS